MSDPLISVRQAKEHAVDDHHQTDMRSYEETVTATDVSDRIGDILRSAREEIGWQISELAQDLCVNGRYLEAIESGNYDQLPGRAYAIGFVRTYAGRLGLDTHEAVELFKREVATHDAEGDLAFPEPVQDRKTPIGAIIVLTIVLGVVIWGVISILNSDDTQEPGVAEVPNELAESTGLSPANPIVAETKPAETLTEEAANVNQQSNPNSERQTEIEQTGLAQVAQSSDPEVLPETESTTSNTSTSAAEEQSILDTVSSETLPASSEDATDIIAIATETNTEINSADSTDADALGTEEEGADQDPQPVVYGQVQGDVRVVLTATAPSWVMVKNSSGRTVFTRTLNKGDIYRVPNISGMVLRTGNAGGLSVSVDGNIAPALGPNGAVRSQIVLEPEPLVAGIQQIRPKPPAESQNTAPTPSTTSETSNSAVATPSVVQSNSATERPAAPIVKPNF